MRTVLYDWSDKQGRARTRSATVYAAMGSESLLLRNENTLPNANASAFATQVDMEMMLCFASLERPSEEQWRALLGQAGFKFLDVWRPQKKQPPGSNVVFEASHE